MYTPVKPKPSLKGKQAYDRRKEEEILASSSEPARAARLLFDPTFVSRAAKRATKQKNNRFDVTELVIKAAVRETSPHPSEGKPRSRGRDGNRAYS